MKKMILSMAVIAAMSATAFADTTNTAPCLGQESGPEAMECPTQPGCEAPMPPRANPFEGIELTEQQQSAIQTMDRQNAEKCMQNLKEEAREAREAQLQARRDYLAQLKNILTTEQYVTFLENNYVNTPSFGRQPRNNGRDNAGRMSRPLQRANRQNDNTALKAQ